MHGRRTHRVTSCCLFDPMDEKDAAELEAGKESTKDDVFPVGVPAARPSRVPPVGGEQNKNKTEKQKKRGIL